MEQDEKRSISDKNDSLRKESNTQNTCNYCINTYPEPLLSGLYHLTSPYHSPYSISPYLILRVSQSPSLLHVFYYIILSIPLSYKTLLHNIIHYNILLIIAIPLLPNILPLYKSTHSQIRCTFMNFTLHSTKNILFNIFIHLQLSRYF